MDVIIGIILITCIFGMLLGIMLLGNMFGDDVALVLSIGALVLIIIAGVYSRINL